jgi:hypothetical protein
MESLPSLGLGSTATAAESVLGMAGELFLVCVVTGCTLLGSLEIARALPRRFSVPALAATGVVALVFPSARTSCSRTSGSSSTNTTGEVR